MPWSHSSEGQRLTDTPRTGTSVHTCAHGRMSRPAATIWVMVVQQGWEPHSTGREGMEDE